MNRLTHTSDCAIASYAERLIRDLNEAQIPFCILRNHEFLTAGAPYDNADLDILVRSRELARTGATLRNLGFIRTRASTDRRHVGYVACAPGSGRVLALDLHLDSPSWNDIPYFSGEAVLRDRVHRSGVPVPSALHTAALLVLHSILDKKAFKPAYVEIINGLLDGGLDPRELQPLFGQFLGPRLARDLVESLKRRDHATAMALRGRTIRRLLGSHPRAWASLALCLWRSRWRRLGRRLFPPGCLAAITGPDGAGKSTVKEQLIRRLEAAGIPVRSFYMGRWHSHILPLAGLAQTRGAEAVAKSDADFADAAPLPGDPVKLHGRPIFRFVRDAVYLAEMFLRYAIRLLPALWRGGIVLTDRYAFDLLLDPNVTLLARFVLTRLYPRPDLCFYLHQSAEVLHQRKAEQSLAELRRQLDVFDRYSDALGYVSLRSDNFDVNVDEIYQRILLQYLIEF